MLKRCLWMFGPLALVALLGVTTAGFPSNPLFQSVTTQTATVSAGSLTVNNTVAGNAPIEFFQTAGTARARLGVEATAGAVVTGSSVGDTFFYTTGGNWLWTLNGGAAVMKLTSAGVLTLNGGLINPPQAVALVSSSTRTSTTTLTADSVLVLTAAAAGTYKVELTAQLQGMNTGQGGIDIAFSLSNAALVSSGNSYTCTYADNGATPIVSGSAFGGAWTSNSGATSGNSCFIAASANAGNPSFLSMVGIVQLSTSSTVQVQWAQAVSNATATQIVQGATLVMTRVL